MMNNTLVLLSLLLSMNASAQTGNTIIQRFNDGSIKSVRYSVDDKDIPANAEEFFSKTLKKRTADDFVLDKSKKTINGMSFERYQQYYNGIKVEGGHYNFRFKNNKMKVVTGHYINVSGVNPVPTITEDEAFAKYVSFLGLNKDVLEKDIKLIIKENPKKQKDGNTMESALVYQVYFTTQYFHDLDIGYVDAHTGKILYTEPSILNSSVNAQFYTFFNRNPGDTPKTGKTEYESGRYILKDLTRGNGIITRYSDNSDVEDLNNIWTREELGTDNYLLDVHWTLEQIYDCLSYYFNHNSYDGNNAQIVALACSCKNAHYNPTTSILRFGSSMFYEDSFNPYGTVDIVGHELGHAILHRTSGLWDNSLTISALHEGFADIWGIIFKSYITPSADIWKNGEGVPKNYSCIRDIKNPHNPTAYRQIASTYDNGTFNSLTSHQASGIFSHWFYLLSQGGYGTNDLGDDFTVFPVSVDVAEQLFAYAVLTTAYLEDITTPEDVAMAIYDASLDMEDNPFLSEQVQNSFYAVGLDIEPSHIFGPLIICGSGTYHVNLDTDTNVSWSFTNTGTGPSPTIVTNSDHTCTIIASSSFTGKLNATISSVYQSVTYSINISGAGNSPSGIGGDVLQVTSLDDTNFLISLRDEKQKINRNVKVFNASNLQLKSSILITNNEYMINTSTWEHGVYIIQVTEGNKTYSTKITIK